MLVALNSQNTSLTFVDVRKQLNFQEAELFPLVVSDASHNQAFSSEQTHNKTENANLTCGEPKTPTALGVVGWCDGAGQTSSAGASYLFGLE